MSKKDDTTSPKVKIKGQYASEISAAGLTHSIFHYHVSINGAEQNQTKDYERDIHLCIKQEEAPENKPLPDIAPPPLEINTLPEAETHTDKDIAVLTLDEAPTSGPNTSNDDKCPPPDIVVEKAMDSPLERVAEVLTRKADKKPFQLPKITPRLRQMKTHLAKLRHTLTPRLPRPDKLKIKAALKPKQRRSFSTRVGQSLLLISIGLIGLAAIYGIDWLAESTPEIRPQSTTPRQQSGTTDSTNKNPSYQARVEQHPDGVVITLQGPDRDEVLTRLPPGYHPIVKDNKIIHIVTHGNTLWFIAKRYIKNPYRYPELARLNHIKNPDLIYPGDRVIIQYISKP